MLCLARLNAATQRRCLRAAEYFGRAAAEARALWGDKGELIVVHALLQQNSMLVAHARTLTAVGDAAPLWLEAYRNVAEIRRILSARLSANTCLVGRCFAVEEEFYFRYKATFMEAGRGNVTPEMKAAFPTLRREVGYEAYMDAAYQGLRFAYPSFTGARPPPLTSEQRRDAQAFALRYMGVLATAPRIYGSSERRFADLLRVLLDSNYLERSVAAS